MKNDLISRQAAIKAICEDGTMLERQGKYTMTMAERKQKDADLLDSLPSSQPGWIPVTKRLPKSKEYVNGVRKHYLVQNEYGDMMVCSWDGCFWTQMYRTTHVKDKVAAWMPLPTPYREGDSMEKVKICPYCCEDSDGYVTPLEKNCHAFIRFGMNGWEIDLSARGWHGSAKIMYCPMCGRKLKNDK